MACLLQEMMKAYKKRKTIFNTLYEMWGRIDDDGLFVAGNDEGKREKKNKLKA